MAIPAYMTIEGIPGSVQVAGREDTIEVLQFDHQVYIPVDRDNGNLTGTRKHGAVVLHKAFDKSSSILYQRVCTGTTIPSITISWYEITPEGEETCYFTHTLTNVKVSSVQSYMHNVKDKSREQYVHQEELTLRYEKMEWNFLDGNLTHTDEWNVR